MKEFLMKIAFGVVGLVGVVTAVAAAFGGLWLLGKGIEIVVSLFTDNVEHYGGCIFGMIIAIGMGIGAYYASFVSGQRKVWFGVLGLTMSFAMFVGLLLAMIFG